MENPAYEIALNLVTNLRSAFFAGTATEEQLRKAEFDLRFTPAWISPPRPAYHSYEPAEVVPHNY